MSKKVVLDLDAIQPNRQSTVNAMTLPQLKQQPSAFQSPIQRNTHQPHHPMSQLFNRPHMLDLDAYTSFRENMINEATCAETIKGWIILIITIPLMSLGLLAYKFVDGNAVVVAFQISAIFALVNFGHYMFCFNKDNQDDQHKSLITIFEATILKLVRALLTAFLIKSVYLSYVSLLLGYSSHINLFFLMLNCKFQSYKLLFGILIASTIPIGLNFNVIDTFLGIIMTGAYMRLQVIKQNPLHSGISWFLSGAILFVVTMLTGMNFQLVSYSYTLLAVVFVILSSKLGKQFLLRRARQNYMSEQIIKCSVKLIPIILFLLYQTDYTYLLFLIIAVVGTILSEYKYQVEEAEDMIVFT